LPKNQDDPLIGNLGILNGELMLDQLELRRLLSSSLSGTILNITGTDSANTIGVSMSSGQIKVSESGLSAKYYADSSVTKIIVKAKKGNDSVTVDSAVIKPCELQGGGGNDTLRGGGGVDALLGQDGNDNLEGGAKNDYLDGGNGDDSADYSARSSKVTANLRVPEIDQPATGSGGGTGESDSYRAVETLQGGAAGDNLAFYGFWDENPGSPRSFLISGNGGKDTLESGAIDDIDSHVTMRGGSGNDQLVALSGPMLSVYGESGDDTVDLGDEDSRGDVYVDTGSGYDTTLYSAEADSWCTVTLGIGCEAFKGGGIIHVIGNELDNVISIYSHWGGSQVEGQEGNDKIVFERNAEQNYQYYAWGGPGNDTILGGESADKLDGGSGNDSIEGFGGHDTLRGEDGNDWLNGADGYDEIHGGSGNDTLYGGINPDRLFGDGGSDKLYGQGGNDRLYGYDGKTDTLDGGSGDDLARNDPGDSLTSLEEHM
jgi:Ca2+-binding RTX toxin-like protein